MNRQDDTRTRDRDGASEAERDAARALPAQFDPRVEEARAAVRAMLAPTGRDLEALLMSLHTESAKHQARARRSRDKARQEFYKRLGGVRVSRDGQEVVVAIVSTRELLGFMEAENNAIKMEAMAQRSYDVHRMATVAQ